MNARTLACLITLVFSIGIAPARASAGARLMHYPSIHKEFVARGSKFL